MFVLPSYVQDPAELDRSRSHVIKNSKTGMLSWKDIFVLRGSASDISKYNASVPLPVIGGLSEEEFSALGCVAGDDWDLGVTWEVTGPTQQQQQQGRGWSGGFTHQVRPQQYSRFSSDIWKRCCPKHVQYMDRPFLVHTWLLQLIVARMKAGGLDMPAPITTRLFQVGGW
jgi:hypothetical protein